MNVEIYEFKKVIALLNVIVIITVVIVVVVVVMGKIIIIQFKNRLIMNIFLLIKMFIILK